MNHVLAAHMMIAVAPDMPVDQQIHLSETAKASDYIKRVGNKGFTLSSQDVRQSVSRSIPETRVTCVFRKTFIFNRVLLLAILYLILRMESPGYDVLEFLLPACDDAFTASAGARL